MKQLYKLFYQLPKDDLSLCKKNYRDVEVEEGVSDAYGIWMIIDKAGNC